MKPSLPGHDWTRREFLKLLGTVGVASGTGLPLGARLRAAAGQDLIALGDRVPLPPLQILRSRDLLSIGLELLNLEVVKSRGDGATAMYLDSHGANGFLVLHFTGQHIAEQAIWDRGSQKKKDGTDTAQALAQKDAPAPLTYRLWKGDADPNSDGDSDLGFLNRDDGNGLRRHDADMLHGLAGAGLSGPSQLVFAVPAWRLPLPFDLDTLLRLCAEELDLVVAPGVAAPTQPDSEAAYKSSLLDKEPEVVTGYHPGALNEAGTIPVTNIEFPALLNLSPYRTARWRLRPAPVGGHAELWGIELEPPDADATPGRPRTLRPRGHVFAFGWRSSDVARWPLPQPINGDADKPTTGKYGPAERPKTALYEATRKLLVKQLYEDNNDIVAVRLRLSALGATARLHYAPALDAPIEGNLEGATPRDDNTDDGGILSEWEQKTETGRDFYSKESFTGYWMPFGFQAEVVTITERLFCSAQPDYPPPRVSIRPPKEQPPKDELPVDLHDDESHLTALLVARKFARIRGSRIRRFTEPESADFSRLTAQAGRHVGLRQVEVLVERTPLLANKGTPPNRTDADQMAAIGRGEDAIVDAGAGTDAAREIFWPRVLDSAADNTAGGNGVPYTQPVIYKFPLRLTFFDGSTRTTEMPMLFVPTLSAGKHFYPAALSDLRTLGVGAKMPVVQPPPPAVIAPADFGTPAQVDAMAGHLKNFLPASMHSLAVPGAKAATITLLTEGINQTLGNLPVEIARRISSVRGDLKTALNAALTALPTDQPGAARQWFKDTVTALIGDLVGDPQKLAGDIEQDLARLVAWGDQIEGAVDARQAAQRLGRLLTPADTSANAAFKGNLGNAVKILQDVLKLASGLTDDQRTLLLADLDGLNTAVNADTDYRAALRLLLIHWVVDLTASWHRRDWDDAFAGVARAMEGPLSDRESADTAFRLSVVQKEIQRALLRGQATVSLKGVPAPQGTVHAPDTAATSLPVVVVGIRDAVIKALQDLETFAQTKVEVLGRLSNALEAAMGEERVLVARVVWLVQDYPLLKADERRRQVGRLFADVRVHLAFALAHYEDGRARWESFLETALAGQELFLRARQAGRDAWNAAQDTVRNAVKNTLDAPAVEVASATMRKLLMVTNPDQLRQRFDQFVTLTGGRLEETLRDEFSRVLPRAVQLLASLDSARTAAVADARQVRAQLEELFGLARDLAARYRGTLAGLLGDAGRLGDLVASLPAGQLPAAKKFIDQLDTYTSTLPPAQLSWRVGAAASDLANDVLRALAADPAMQAAAQQTASELKTIAQDINTQLCQDSAVARDKLDRLQHNLGTITTRLDVELSARITGLADLVDGWLDVRVDEAVEHLVVVFWAMLDRSAVTFDQQLEKWLGAFVNNPSTQGTLAAAAALVPGAAAAAAELRKFTGEVENIDARFNSLPADVKAQAATALKNFQDAAKGLGQGLATGLTRCLDHVEGDLLSLAKRASLSLPSTALFNRFQDQTRKAIFQTAQACFSVDNIGDGVRTFLAHPLLENLNVEIPGVDGQRTIKLAEDYLDQGLRDFDRAKNEVFADLVNTASTLAENSGVADVAATVDALSREAGNLADKARTQLEDLETQARIELQKIRQGAQATLDNLKDLANTAAADLIPDGPKLFNAITLTDVLAQITSAGSLPAVIAHQFPDRIERNFSLATDAKALDLGVIAFTPEDNCRFRLDSHATLWVPGPGRPLRAPTYSVRGQLDAFTVEVARLLAIHFLSLTFTSENGSFDCKPKLGRVGGDGGSDPSSVVEFLGPLEFVNDLRNTLAALLGKSGLAISIEDDTIFAGMRLRIPDLTLGAVAVTNLALNFGVGLPLGKGPLRCRFALSDRVETFRIAVSIFAGGGFFGLELSSQPELCKVEGALEFGGSLSLSLTVASGSVSAMGGIYFSWSGVGSDVNAYFRVCGNVNVLGLVDISLVIFLALGYRNDGQQSQLYGEASVSIQIKIGFFSKSFSLSYEYTVNGSSNQHTTALDHAAPWDAPGAELASASGLMRRASAHLAWLEMPDVDHSPGGGGGGGGNLRTNAAPRFQDVMKEKDFTDYWAAFDHTLAPRCEAP